MLRLTEVENGKIRGIAGTNPRITVFKGVPYAAPPVGENRWKAPQPYVDWQGIYEAKEYAPIAFQDTPGVSGDLYCRE
ncbi:MAG: carboxylesterase family protein [Butyrivibrio sp.]|nr:carboxylesterase family protein [Butyrivibrio sp.]